MAEIQYGVELEGDSHYTLPALDTLGVLASTRAVVEVGEQVWINEEGIAALSGQWIAESSKQGNDGVPAWDEHYHFFDDSEHTVNWLLVLDALNFCFWAEKGQPRWHINYKDELLNGYWAEAAALKRAVEEDVPLWDAQYLSTISSEAVAAIFRGEPQEPVIPLFEQRVHNLREVGQVLLARYDGQFTHAIESVQGSAVQLALLLAQDFPSFRDIATYHGYEVRVLKRAQICVADIHAAFKGEKWGTFHDIDQLTVFADYKLPQVLRHYQVLEYVPSLARRIDAQELLTANSEEEIEIRAATVWACELLRRALQQKGHPMSAANIDYKLWLLGQSLPAMRPYHRTRTIYY